MKNMKKKALIAASYVAVAALAIGGTLAYLTDTEGDKNTMTMGKVDIEQLEYERVVDDNGNWVSTGEADKYGYIPDQLQEFTQDKPLYPAVYDNDENTMIWDDRDDMGNNGAPYQQSWGQVGASGSLQLFDDSVKNVIDKMVFVKNTGKSDAYVRTVFAFEAGCLEAADLDDVIIHTNADGNHWDLWGKFADKAIPVTIDGVEYYMVSATYVGPSNGTGVLEAGKVSYPSLAQVYLDPAATNEICESFGETYDILVVSQAVQTEGFDNADDALNAAFGELSDTNNPWTSTTEVASNDALAEAIAAGGNINVASDITNAPTTATEAGNAITTDTTIDMDGNEYTYDLSNVEGTLDGVGLSAFSTVDGATLTLTDANIVSDGYGVYAKGGEIVINGGSYVADTTAVQANGGTVIIEGGYFESTSEMYGATYLLNLIDHTNSQIIVKGGTFVNFNPADNKAENPQVNFVADGYKVVEETQANGDIWYTVVAE